MYIAESSFRIAGVNLGAGFHLALNRGSSADALKLSLKHDLDLSFDLPSVDATCYCY